MARSRNVERGADTARAATCLTFKVLRRKPYEACGGSVPESGTYGTRKLVVYPMRLSNRQLVGQEGEKKWSEVGVVPLARRRTSGLLE